MKYLKIKYFYNESKYLKWYFDLIEKRKNDPPNEFYEKHHILPKSIFPEFENDIENLVSLSYREHFIAHILLYKHYKYLNKDYEKTKMAFPLTLMKYFSSTEKHNSRKFEYVKKISSINRIGKSTITEEGRERISKRMKKNNPSNIKIKCSFCHKEFSPTNYYRYHGIFCKNNPKRLINQSNINATKKTSERLKNFATFIHIFNFNKKIRIEKNKRKWYMILKKSNARCFIFEKNNEIIQIFPSIFHLEHYMSLFGLKTDTIKEWIKRDKIYSKNNFINESSKNLYYIPDFEGIKFKTLYHKDIDEKFFLNNKDKIYKQVSK